MGLGLVSTMHGRFHEVVYLLLLVTGIEQRKLTHFYVSKPHVSFMHFWVVFRILCSTCYYCSMYVDKLNKLYGREIHREI